MNYALHPLVSIWMGLYYNLPRIRKWAREKNITPSVSQTFQYLSTQRFREGDFQRFRKTRLDYNLFKRRRLESTLNALEAPWRRVFELEDVNFQAGKRVHSLLDFPRFQGSSWSHNDIIVYVPDNKGAAVMKLSDAKFNPLHEKLSTLLKGVDPFVGTSFEVSESKLNPVFNRIRCSSRTSVSLDSFQRIASFSDLTKSCGDAKRAPGNIASVLMGNAPLDLTKCVIARYENYYCLMEFFLSEARIKSAVREKDWSYNFVFDFEGVSGKAWMFRDSLFDSLAFPEKIPKNSKVDVLGFVTYGRTSLQAFGTRIHLVALHPIVERPSVESSEVATLRVPTINSVEAEMIRMGIRKERMFHMRGRPKVIVPKEYKFVKVDDSLVLGDLARSLSASSVSVQDLFNWDNGGQPLVLQWSKGGRRSSNATEELRSALKFILGMRGSICIPQYLVKKDEGERTH